MLGGGGPVGYAFHAGVLAALSSAGFSAATADLLVGTSIGSVTAALLRAGLSPADLHARVTETPLSDVGAALLERAGGWPTFPSPSATGAPRWGSPASPALLGRLVRRPAKLRVGLVLAGLANAGVVDPSPIATGLERLLGSTWPPGLWVCAVDLDTGRRMAFGKSSTPSVDVGTAVAASCAVPSYFRPVEVGGRRYVDGGVRSPANTDLVCRAAEAPDVVVVSLPMGMSGPAGRRGIDIPGRRRNTTTALRGLEPLVAAGVPVLLLAPTASELEVMRYDAFATDRLDDIAARAHASTAGRLASPGAADRLALGALGIS